MAGPTGPEAIRESEPGIPGFFWDTESQRREVCTEEGSTCQRGASQLGAPTALPAKRRGEASQDWPWGSQKLLKMGPAPAGCLLSLLWLGPHRSPLYPRPPQGRSDPCLWPAPAGCWTQPPGAQGDPSEGRAWPCPGVCLQVCPAPHKLVSRDFSTQNMSPREATGLMSWVCGRSLPALRCPHCSVPQ